LNDNNFEKITAIDDSVTLDSFIVAKMEQYHFPGLAACIVQNDQIIWKGNYGYADIAQNKLVDDSTLFSIESVSKTITGTALLQLWEKGLFELDDDINNYLPFELKNPSSPNDSITFRMLLTHTSSIWDDWNLLNSIVTWGGDSPLILSSFLQDYLLPGGNYYSSSHWLNNTPGSYYEYSHIGYLVADYLIESIAKKSYDDYCQENIFSPLGMYETSWFFANLDMSKIATPYTYSGGEYIPSDQYGEVGGEIRSSVSQLARFLMAFIQKGELDGARILESASVDSMISEQFPVYLYDPPGRQGFAWYMYEWEVPFVGVRTFCQHYGERRFGANAYIGFLMDENVGCIVLANSVNEDGIYEIVDNLLSYGIITNIESQKIKPPLNYSLNQNYPNPFNPSTTIEFILPKSEFVELKVYNILGKKVATLVSNKLNSGNHSYTFDGRNLASGIYYCQLVAGEYKEVKKMILIK
jgi:CubicO group peptidase (beta-lactamase class C family)